MTVPPLAALILSYSILAIPFTLLFQRPTRLEPSFRLLLVYALVAFLVDRIPELVEVSSTTARILSFAFTIFEYTLFTLLFYRFFNGRYYKRWVIGGSLLYVGIVVLELQKFGVVYYSRFNAGTAVILIISYSLLLFHEWLNDDPMVIIYSKAAFWITMGCMVYLSGNFFFFITVGKQWEQHWAMHAISNFLRNMLFVVAILQAYPATRPKKIF